MDNVRSALLSIVAIASVWAFVPRALRAQSPAPLAKPTVEIERFSYRPATLTVETGTTVDFRNSGTVPRTVTANDRSFDSGKIHAGASWLHVFTEAGIYDYACAYDHHLHGSIVVK
ncbi:MAG: cupredoxin domain-containing protein [Candidatus Eremiobacteraeota bacterium]|nr:cupredoxin domain-containing protein [Candidatus Eremiobacteraeota bacterium]